MAVLYMVEYSNLPTYQGVAQLPSEPPIAEQTVAIGGTAASSSPLNPRTRFVRLTTDVVCAVSLTATAATATGTGTVNGTGHRMSAGMVEYIGVERLPPGSVVSVIATT